MEITVDNLMDLFVDKDSQTVEIFNCETGQTVYEGDYQDIPMEYQDATVESIDNIFQGNSGKITLNVSIREED